MSWRVLLAVLGAVLGGVLGCASSSQFQSARVLPRGETRATVAAEFHRFRPGPEVDGPLNFPELELQLREGVLEDRLECGGKLYGFGLKGDCKFQVLRSRFVDLSFAPGFGATSSLLSAHILDGYLTVLGGLNLWREPFQPGGVSLVLSMTHVGRCFVAQGADGEGCFAQRGFSGAVHLQLTESVALIPEVSTMATIGPPRASFGPMNGPWIQGGLGVSFRKPERQRPAPK